MSSRRKEILKRFLFLPAIAIGVAVLAYFVQQKQKPERYPAEETVRAVRVIAAPTVDVVPRALGYGVVSPATVWEAVSDVQGRVVQRHERLERGAILPAGTLLLKIDPSDYELAASRIRADIAAVQGQIAELDASGSNLRASLAIEERSLALAERDLERKKNLLAKGNIAQAAVDEEERRLLTSRQAVQNLKNSLNLIPAKRSVLAANLEQNRVRLADAELDLQRTSVTLPFDARIAAVHVEQAQQVKLGQVMVIADAIDVAEVAAQIPIDRMRNLLPQDVQNQGLTMERMSNLAAEFDLDAVVRLRTGDFIAEWPARFDRISDTLDPETRTVGVIVAVDDSYRGARPAVRPPLVKNMYVEVELRGQPRNGAVVVPRTAVHGDRVYVVAEEQRLARRKVDIAFRQTNFVVLGNGLAAGDQVVLTDLVPAIDGMRLAPVADDDALAELLAEAKGERSVK